MPFSILDAILLNTIMVNPNFSLTQDSHPSGSRSSTNTASKSLILPPNMMTKVAALTQEEVRLWIDYKLVHERTSSIQRTCGTC